MVTDKENARNSLYSKKLHGSSCDCCILSFIVIAFVQLYIRLNVSLL